MDKTKPCIDCHEDFTLTEGELQFFLEKGLTEPKRCAPCRKIKKDGRASEGRSRDRY